MKVIKLVWLELGQRKTQLMSGILAITLGISVIVAIRSISLVSEKAVAINLDNLGANIMVLPQGATIDNYYSADIDAPTIPEEYVERILTSSLQGVDNLSPKLTRRVDIGDYKFVLTGILPSNELASKPLWQSAGLFGAGLAASCGENPQNESLGYKDEKLQRKSIDSLAMADCLLGYSAAQKLGLKEGGVLTIMGNELKVARVLTETGTIDDDRVFAHLRSVQNILGIHDQVSAIEIMGCCNAISDGLLGQLRNILPDTRITTIGQIVSTQIKTNQLMNQISLIILIIILIVGGISIGNYMWANVNERRKEIGILRMIGFHKSSIYSMLLIKAVFMGVVGGLAGYLAGALIAWFLGPTLAGIIVVPIPLLLLYSVLLAAGIAVVGSLLPAYFASRFEPYSNMQEI
ncbi:MAG TPA: ABC transporter permease [Bacteroidales bacterium]|nr:ABC transporter permease [Bacteroidales bacterium]HOX76594.1 ABC transporter permease [Bacteroidales bacterium]HPM92519.1 ABC transporter permease [Bacteroidales bacterium]